MDKIVENMKKEIEKMERFNSMTSKETIDIKNGIREIRLLLNNTNKLTQIQVYDWDKTLDIALKARNEMDLERKKRRYFENEKRRKISRDVRDRFGKRRKREDKDMF